MAIPRVFISSTCYDLSEVRDRLVSFCESFGFESVLSERGDVFYHPDLHTHESCLGEIGNCQLFILIVGGRFGCEYVIDTEKSVTNAEFFAAKKLGVPVFTFIKNDVLHDYNTYQKNKDKDFVESIDFPSIEKQEYAGNIFEFVSSVKLSNVNNGFFGFTLAKDIEVYLRKQLAGMFFDFLSDKSTTNQFNRTNQAVSDLTALSKKIEDLVKSLYRQVGSEKADSVIRMIDKLSEAESFFVHVSDKIDMKRFIPISIADELSTSSCKTWYEFLIRINGFIIISDFYDLGGKEFKFVGYEPTKKVVGMISGEFLPHETQDRFDFEKEYRAFCDIDQKERRELILKFCIDF